MKSRSGQAEMRNAEDRFAAFGSRTCVNRRHFGAVARFPDFFPRRNPLPDKHLGGPQRPRRGGPKKTRRPLDTNLWYMLRNEYDLRCRSD